MPAKEIMGKFMKGKLHSGTPDGPIVTNPHQAKAIQMSYARKEGADIPQPDEKSKPAKRKSIGQRMAERAGY